jgi:hypothetical protein
MGIVAGHRTTPQAEDVLGPRLVDLALPWFRECDLLNAPAGGPGPWRLTGTLTGVKVARAAGRALELKYGRDTDALLEVRVPSAVPPSAWPSLVLRYGFDASLSQAEKAKEKPRVTATRMIQDRLEELDE